MRGQLFLEGVSEVHPEVFAILVHVAKSEIFPLQNSKRLAHLVVLGR